MYFTYPNFSLIQTKMFVAFDRWGSDNRGFTVGAIYNAYLKDMAMCSLSSSVYPKIKSYKWSLAVYHYQFMQKLNLNSQIR